MTISEAKKICELCNTYSLATTQDRTQNQTLLLTLRRLYPKLEWTIDLDTSNYTSQWTVRVKLKSVKKKK